MPALSGSSFGRSAFPGAASGRGSESPEGRRPRDPQPVQSLRPRIATTPLATGNPVHKTARSMSMERCTSLRSREATPWLAGRRAASSPLLQTSSELACEPQPKDDREQQGPPPPFPTRKIAAAPLVKPAWIPSRDVTVLYVCWNKKTRCFCVSNCDRRPVYDVRFEGRRRLSASPRSIIMRRSGPAGPDGTVGGTIFRSQKITLKIPLKEDLEIIRLPRPVMGLPLAAWYRMVLPDDVRRLYWKCTATECTKGLKLMDLDTVLAIFSYEEKRMVLYGDFGEQWIDMVVLSALSVMPKTYPRFFLM